MKTKTWHWFARLIVRWQMIGHKNMTDPYMTSDRCIGWIREDTWEELPRWAVVLPPNTVKIRGRCSIFLTIVKLVSCYPMQLRQGQDAPPSVKLMPTTPWSQDKGRMLHLLSWTRGSPFVDYEASHISEPVFPGGTSVFRVHTILTLPNLPRCSMIDSSHALDRVRFCILLMKLRYGATG